METKTEKSPFTGDWLALMKFLPATLSEKDVTKIQITREGEEWKADVKKLTNPKARVNARLNDLYW